VYSFTQVRIWSICRPYISHLQEEHIEQLHSGQNVEHLQTEHLSSARGAHCAATLRKECGASADCTSVICKRSTLCSYIQVRILSICCLAICHLQDNVEHLQNGHLESARGAHSVQLNSCSHVEHLQTLHLLSARGAHWAATLR
jgi:hypothetical protein